MDEKEQFQAILRFLVNEEWEFTAYCDASEGPKVEIPVFDGTLHLYSDGSYRYES